ncbi:hypothetical protein [Mesorhizobium cantuariense]|uniref:DUF1161 domain-containing protein n=1 Tax=Mesorhizobium cantuariense TaxID=1300275 RepID=A0ABV7MR46_9HYPH
MNMARAIRRSVLPALCLAALLAAQTVPGMTSDCYGIGQQIAAQDGGTLAKANEANRGGQTVCAIVVLVPGKDGQRPRREEQVVPAD